MFGLLWLMIHFCIKILILECYVFSDISLLVQKTNVLKECRRMEPRVPQNTYLDLDSAKLLANALVFSCLDYCNSLLYGIAATDLNKLQRVHN